MTDNATAEATQNPVPAVAGDAQAVAGREDAMDNAAPAATGDAAEAGSEGRAPRAGRRGGRGRGGARN
ncbi:Fertility inhibition FinO, partial [Paracidovorax avenae]